MIYQHIYSRCNRGYYTRSEGYDTAAKSPDLPDAILQSGDMRAITQYPNIDLGKYGSAEETNFPAIRMYFRKAKASVLGNTVIPSAVYGNNQGRRIFLTHQYIALEPDELPFEHPEELLLGTSFLDHYDELSSGNTLPSLNTLTKQPYEPVQNNLRGELSMNYGQFAYFMTGLLQSLSRETHNFVVLLDMPPHQCSEKATRLMAAIDLLLPISLRKRATFCTFWPDIKVAGFFNIIFSSSRIFSMQNVLKNTCVFDFTSPAESSPTATENSYIALMWDTLDNPLKLQVYTSMLEDPIWRMDGTDNITELLDAKLKSRLSGGLTRAPSEIDFLNMLGYICKKISLSGYTADYELDSILGCLEQKLRESPSEVLLRKSLELYVSMKEKNLPYRRILTSLEDTFIKSAETDLLLAARQRALFQEVGLYDDMRNILALRSIQGYYRLLQNEIAQSTITEALSVSLQMLAADRGNKLKSDLEQPYGSSFLEVLQTKLETVEEFRADASQKNLQAAIEYARKINQKYAYYAARNLFDIPRLISKRIDSVENITDISPQVILTCREEAPRLFQSAQSGNIAAAHLLSFWYLPAPIVAPFKEVQDLYISVCRSGELCAWIQSALRTFAKKYTPEPLTTQASAKHCYALLLLFSSEDGEIDYVKLLATMCEEKLNVLPFVVGVVSSGAYPATIMEALCSELTAQLRSGTEQEWKKTHWRRFRRSTGGITNKLPFMRGSRKIDLVIAENKYLSEVRESLLKKKAAAKTPEKAAEFAETSARDGFDAWQPKRQEPPKDTLEQTADSPPTARPRNISQTGWEEQSGQTGREKDASALSRSPSPIPSWKEVRGTTSQPPWGRTASQGYRHASRGPTRSVARVLLLILLLLIAACALLFFFVWMRYMK